MAEYQFKCPECGGTRLNEVMVNVTVDSEIDRVNKEEGIVYGDQTNEDGEVLHVCCRNCGVVLMRDGGIDRQPFTITPDGIPLACITTEEELIKWLKSHMAS